MRLKLMIPERVLVEEDAGKIVARSTDGYFCLLPRHVDFVALLAPGILSFESPDGQVSLVGVDEGTLVKVGDEVLVSVRHAERGDDLDELKRIVSENFMSPGEAEKLAREITRNWAEEFLPMYIKAGQQ